MSVSGFTVESFGKLYRSCGNCKTMYERHVIFNDITATDGKSLAGINCESAFITPFLQHFTNMPVQLTTVTLPPSSPSPPLASQTSASSTRVTTLAMSRRRSQAVPAMPVFTALLMSLRPKCGTRVESMYFTRA